MVQRCGEGKTKCGSVWCCLLRGVVWWDQAAWSLGCGNPLNEGYSQQGRRV